MDNQSFQQLITELDVLPNEQRQTLLNRLQYLISHADALRLIEERLGAQPHCPHCHDPHIVCFDYVHHQQRYRSKGCHHTLYRPHWHAISISTQKDKLLKYAECMA